MAISPSAVKRSNAAYSVPALSFTRPLDRIATWRITPYPCNGGPANAARVRKVGSRMVTPAIYR